MAQNIVRLDEGEEGAPEGGRGRKTGGEVRSRKNAIETRFLSYN